MKKMNVGIYVPVYFREDKVRKCLESFLITKKSSNKYLLNVFLGIGINGAEKTLHDYILSFFNNHAKKEGFDVCIHDWNHNHGKPCGVNMMVNHTLKGCTLDYVCSCDSDMIFIDPNWLLKTVDAFETYNRPDHPLGALCPDQLQSCCHIMNEEKLIYKWGSHEINWRPGNVGTAGGVLFTPYSLWGKFKGYKAHRIYASDDGHYADLCSRNNYIMAVLKDVQVVHPNESDNGYNSWKRKIMVDELPENEKQGYQFK